MPFAKLLSNILPFGKAWLGFVFLASCTNQEFFYYDAIPSQSKAIVRVASEDRAKASLELFMGDDALTSSENSGVDISAPVYLFAAPDGSLGACAKVKDDDEIDNLISALAKAGKASGPKELKDCKYAVVNMNFLVAYNEDALVAVGPVIASDEQKVAKRLMRYLTLDPERGIGETDIFKEIEGAKSPVSLIASISVMPKKLVVPFLIGTPTGTSTDDVMLKADVSVNDSVLTLMGRTTSDNLLIRQGIDNAMNILAKGNSEEIIHVMESNKDFMTMLNSGGFREKLRNVQGRMLIIQSGNDTEVETLQGTEANILMKVSVNLKSLDREVMSIFEPFLGGVKRIEYEVRPLPPLCTYSDVINIGLPSVGREPECAKD